MEKKLNDLAFGISVSDSDILDNSFEDFERNAEITEEEQNRILSAVMRKAGYNMNNNVTVKESSNKRVKVIFRRAAAVLAAAVLAVGTLSTLVSADVANTYDVVYSVSPAIAQTLKPLNAACESNGIEMNVVSASIVDNDVYAYVSITDKQGNRIDSTVDLFDSYFIKTPFGFDSMGGCHLDKYDEETNTAYFFINISSMDGKSIAKYKNKKITFSLNTLLTGKQNYEGELTDIDITGVTEQPSQTIGEDLVYGYSGESADFSHEQMTQFPCLIPESEPISEPIEGVTVTAVGYIDGKLHVQTHYDNTFEFDNHGFISLIDSSGNKIDSSDALYFSDENNESNSYFEQEFDIPAEKISEYKLYGEFTTCTTRIDGDWEVTFKVE